MNKGRWGAGEGCTVKWETLNPPTVFHLPISQDENNTRYKIFLHVFIVYILYISWPIIYSHDYRCLFYAYIFILYILNSYKRIYQNLYAHDVRLFKYI